MALKNRFKDGRRKHFERFNGTFKLLSCHMAAQTSLETRLTPLCDWDNYSFMFGLSLGHILILSIIELIVRPRIYSPMNSKTLREALKSARSTDTARKARAGNYSGA